MCRCCIIIKTTTSCDEMNNYLVDTYKSIKQGLTCHHRRKEMKSQKYFTQTNWMYFVNETPVAVYFQNLILERIYSYYTFKILIFTVLLVMFSKFRGHYLNVGYYIDL